MSAAADCVLVSVLNLFSLTDVCYSVQFLNFCHLHSHSLFSYFSEQNEYGLSLKCLN